jgi:hypothetical protein
MFPMNRKPVPVCVQYTLRGQRVLKRFEDAYTARRFYAAKSRAGADPKVVAAVEQVMSETTTTSAATPVATPKTRKGKGKGKGSKASAKAKKVAKKSAAKRDKWAPVNLAEDKLPKNTDRIAKFMLKRGGQLTRAEIVQGTGGISTVAGPLNRVVSYFSRTVSKEDGRTPVYTLTAAGKAYAQKLAKSAK